MKKPVFMCLAFTLVALVPAAHAGSKVVHKPTPNPEVVTTGKDANSAAKYVLGNTLPLKIDAVNLASTWTPCEGLSGYAQAPGSGNLLGKSAITQGFCGMASVRLKKTVATANLAGKNITIQVSEQHYNITPWSTIVGLYTLPFPPSGDTLTYGRVAVGSFPGDNPAGKNAFASNRQRQMDADYAFHLGRPVLVELRHNGETVDKKTCTFTALQSPNGPGSAKLTCP